MEKISITRALTELKTILKRIESKVGNTAFVGLFRGEESKLANGAEKTQFSVQVLAEYKSIEDLSNRWLKLKTAIAASNVETKVTLCGEEMTVEKCIAYKKLIDINSQLLASLRSQLLQAERSTESINKKVEEQIENILRSNTTLAGNKNNTEVDAFIKSYRKVNDVSIFDPINVRKEIAVISEKMDKITSEIDFVLSESNARTTIEI